MKRGRGRGTPGRGRGRAGHHASGDPQILMEKGSVFPGKMGFIKMEDPILS